MLSWTNLNPTVKISGTKKKFFGRYLYKIIVWCPAGSVIYDKHETDASFLLQQRLDRMSRAIHYHSSFATRADYVRENAVPEQLQYFIDLKQSNNNQLRLRVEEPTITIYSDDSDLLYTIAAGMPDTTRLEEVHAPFSAQATEALNRGEIIIKTPMAFEYKVTLKETSFRDISIKQNILDYLYNLDKNDEVCLTKSLVKNLGTNFSYFQGGYFYARDEKAATFINLMHPGLVSGIFKLALLES